LKRGHDVPNAIAIEAPPNTALGNAPIRGNEPQPNPDQQRKQDFGSHRPIGSNQKRPLQYLFEQLSVDLHAGDAARDRGGLQVVDNTRSRGSLPARCDQ
jgi:hypothetical protein